MASCPCALLFGVWGLVLLIRAVQVRRRSGRGALAFNVGVLLLGLAVLEVLLIRPPRADIRFLPASGAQARRMMSSALGYVPTPNRCVRSAVVVDGAPVFDVHYGIDPRGLRDGPPTADAPEGTVLCFGCSFTFGFGLEDDETYPWQLQQLVGGRLQVENLGYIGYGPHQMLAQIQEGVAEAAARAPVRHAVYLAIVDHPRRVSGREPSSRHTPRFDVTDDGTPIRRGLWSDEPSSVGPKRLLQLLRHANLFARVMEHVEEGGTAGDLRRYVAIVRQARDELHARWPDGQFHVVVWDDEDRLSARLIEALEGAGIEPIRMSEVAPDFRSDLERHRLHPADVHPSRHANRILAEYLAARFTAPATTDEGR